MMKSWLDAKKNCFFMLQNWWEDIFPMELMGWFLQFEHVDMGTEWKTLSWVKLYDDQSITNSVGHSGTDEFNQHFRYLNWRYTPED